MQIADNNTLSSTGIGTVKVEEKVNGQIHERVLQDVLYVPSLRRNLFSIPAITEKGFSFFASKDTCEI